jgi:lipid-A-disaccharide synthase
VAGRVKQAAPHIPTIHYVAPTVWAWRPKRAQKMAGLYDHVMALFPFEPPYMQAAGISCDFVGHPVVAAPPVTDADKAALRTTLGIGGDDPVILALPGSRQSEVERLAPIFGQTLHHIDRTQNPPHIILPAAPGMAELVAGQIQTWPGPVHVLNPADLPPDQGQHRKRVAFAMADVALAASGTVSLELAAANTPMVIAYKTNWLSQILIKSLLQIDTVTLVNLITDTRVVPEFLGANCRADQIAPTLLALLTDPAAQDGQRAAMRATMAQLGQGGDAPGLRAAQSVTRFIKGKA